MNERNFKCNNLTINSDSETMLCGIINVTPDSFSDGGKYNTVDKAVEKALNLVKQGAGILDIGGESTRPGSTLISPDEEISRIVPVISAIKNHETLKNIPISIDTWKSKVADESLSAGADIVNDITGLFGDKNMADVVSKHNAGLIIMFNSVIARPNFKTAKNFPKFTDFNYFASYDVENMNIITLMNLFFDKSIEICKNVGIKQDKIMLDPGIGFGLTKKENLEIINNIDIIHKRNYCSFLGVSRKRFIANILESTDYNIDMSTEEGLDNMDEATSYLSSIASFLGTNVLRVHNIDKNKNSVKIGNAIRLYNEIDDITFNKYSK